MDLDNRLINLESAVELITQEINKLPSREERFAIADEIFDEIRDLRLRLNVITNAIALAKSRLENRS